MKEKIKIGISSCLLGEKVRYDGGHKLDPFLKDILGKYVEYVPICPETECGLGTPREAMQLVGDPKFPKIQTIHSKVDHTKTVQAWTEKRVEELKEENLRGFIFKSKSPSCGLGNVEVTSADRVTEQNGTGLFAKIFSERFPSISVIDNDLINNHHIGRQFLNRLLPPELMRALIVSNETS